MGPEEIDIALDELENRLDRLRSLYEQYFLGIEKIEPGVARKDVDRRFWLLRRVQIRNTARRFRLQVLIQRYNTFQQHWARICREIENGTYTRHLLRAKKSLGEEPKTWAAKKRLGYFRRRAEGENGEAETAASGDDLGAMLDGGTDLAAEAVSAAQGALAAVEARLPGSIPPPVAASKPQVPSDRPLEVPKPAARRSSLETLDLDLDDDLGGAAPAPAPRPLARPASPQSAATGPAPRPLARPAPPQSAATGPAPRPLARPAPPQSAVPVHPLPKPALPVAGKSQTEDRALVSAAPSPTAARPNPVERPAVAPAIPKPAATAAKALNVPATPARPAVPPDPAGISEARLRQLHGELAAAKRQANQADAVSLEALSKSLRESEKRIRAQHPGRSVDFHVVMKDGKPVVKPIVRK